MGDIPKPEGIPKQTHDYNLELSPSYAQHCLEEQTIQDFANNNHEKGNHAPINTKKESKVNNSNDIEESYLPSFKKRLVSKKLF